MRIFRVLPFLLGKICADIIWTCDQAADLCIYDMTYIPEHEICEDTFCLDSKPDLCFEHSVFKNGEYGRFFCERGRRDHYQVRNSKSLLRVK